MAEYIERSTVLTAINEFYHDPKVDIAIRNIPSADVIEVVHGEWIAHGYKWRCSVCNRKLNLDGTSMENGFYFCPNCGAKMDGDKK